MENNKPEAFLFSCSFHFSRDNRFRYSKRRVM